MADQKNAKQEEMNVADQENAKQDGRVSVHIPRGGVNEDPNLFVSINGKNYLVPKGKTSLVPPEVAEEIHRSRRAAERADERSEAMMSKQ